ncbi:glycerophosphodiester phosphodiesterase family protein [Streptomyces sp. DSM 42041]|uniref:Glycerophosphodiester phosphodiesterase family protein n=1 Tax=Streptomyces hazeniae TaxID=3075538 RepID=A0ABU2NT24_9ACTN|nr:glycerophosphodiester phosphodiesterase family protein [Streptomyces sp. DSM 42041]MDT0379909.1 glycerophosphodiester phosphodiesterase family protein [Streptomyces sp. DSM 42041]
MAMRPLTVAAGALLGLSTLFLSATPAASAAGVAAALPAAKAAAKPGPGRAPVVVAHRGASAYAPENTLAAVDAAHDLGFAWVENDVQRTRDGELVVLHDESLARTTDVEEVFPDRAPWRVADFTAAEVARLDAGSWFGEEFAGERIPTLEQYLRRVEANGQRLLLELKKPTLYPGVESQTLKELANEGWLDRQHVARRLVIQSFEAGTVRTVHELAPEVTTGFLGTPAAADLPGYAAFTDQINPNHSTVTADYVSEVQALEGAHGRPLEVFTWTVDDAATARRVAEAGVDGIISNAPDVVRDAVGR